VGRIGCSFPKNCASGGALVGPALKLAQNGREGGEGRTSYLPEGGEPPAEASWGGGGLLQSETRKVGATVWQVRVTSVVRRQAEAGLQVKTACRV